MEGPNLPIKSVNMRKMQLGGSNDGKEGLAASLAELTKRVLTGESQVLVKFEGFPTKKVETLTFH
ncbi:conserved hypothetical protein [Ricinus communis]|uniref:Uncharacterized protein n=1 Tax=Ricinus communis TaxID=3988 RepID=B9SPV7_RICCO|nr:conserved hypothetical protein [Ricinus communis]